MSVSLIVQKLTKRPDLVKRNTKHNHARRGKLSKTYVLWKAMIQRCTDLNSRDYISYGGRGITVCKHWCTFINFLEDMGEIPSGYQIDRINNNGNYCKSNCRWVTSKVNSRNKRNNHLITFNGKTQCMSAWAEEYDINYQLLWKRMCVYRWSIDKALTEPKRGSRKVSP